MTADPNGSLASYPPPAPEALDLDAIEARYHDAACEVGDSDAWRSATDVPALVARVRELEAALTAAEAETRTALDALHKRCDAAEAEVAAVTAEHDRERTARRDYESCITFETACVTCAKALDAQLAAEERAEKAEAQLAAARPVLLLDAIRRGHVGPSTCARCGAQWRERGGNCEACGHPDAPRPIAENVAAAGECFAETHPYAAGAIMGGIAHRSEVKRGQ